jgi:peptide deformylase
MSESTQSPDRDAAGTEPVEPEGPSEEAELELDEEARERRRAALAHVRTFGDPVLNSVASPVGEFDSNLAAEGERMVEIMQDAHGVGLAATQLGLLRRLLVFQAGPDAKPRALANPRLEWASETLATAEEGCLSLPGIVLDVERPLHVRVAGADIDGESILIEASGLEARVLQHEIDHLDGVLTIDRTRRDQRRAAIAALREGRPFNPEELREVPPEELREAAPAEA